MEFLNPAILWGLIALAIPALIHLWNGRQGIKISWAASRFLEENENKPVRHIKFEQWLLLLLRLFLLTLLLLILAKLYWDKLSNAEEKRVIHLVEPSREILSEFRFELQQAINKGEEIFLLDQEQNRIENLDQFTMESKNEPMHFGNLLIQKEEIPEEVHLYLSGNESSFTSFFYPVIVRPTLHLSQFFSPVEVNNLIQLNDNKILFINPLNEIEISDETILNAGQIFGATFNYYLDVESEKHAEIIEASLKSLEEVFGLKFKNSEKENAQLYFTEKNLIDPKPEWIYWKTGDLTEEQYGNIYPLRAFEKGAMSIEAYQEIPEQIMTDLLDFLNIKGKSFRLNEVQIQSRFHLLDQDQKPTQANTFEILWLLLLLVLVIERIFSNKLRL